MKILITDRNTGNVDFSGELAYYLWQSGCSFPKGMTDHECVAVIARTMETIDKIVTIETDLDFLV